MWSSLDKKGGRRGGVLRLLVFAAVLVATAAGAFYVGRSQSPATLSEGDQESLDLYAEALDTAVVEMVRGWAPAVEAELIANSGVPRATRLALTYIGAFPDSYRSRSAPEESAADILRLVNTERGKAGCQPLTLNETLTKAAQAHMVRLLAAELGDIGVRVNGINPDGIVKGSGIFAGGWGASRAKTYGIEEEDLGKFYAQRTLLKREVLPEHVANAVFVLTAGELSHTTGLHVPVDAGVAAAFLR